MSILEKDDLKLEEIDIWDRVIEWGIGQNEEELAKDIEGWKNEVEEHDKRFYSIDRI